MLMSPAMLVDDRSQVSLSGGGPTSPLSWPEPPGPIEIAAALLPVLTISRSTITSPAIGTGLMLPSEDEVAQSVVSLKLADEVAQDCPAATTGALLDGSNVNPVVGSESAPDHEGRQTNCGAPCCDGSVDSAQPV